MGFVAKVKSFVPVAYVVVCLVLLGATLFILGGCAHSFVDDAGQIRDANGNNIYPPLSYEPVSPSTEEQSTTEGPQD